MASSAQTSLDMGGEQPKLPFEPVEEVWHEVTNNIGICDV
jgi:hypothetical protein